MPRGDRNHRSRRTSAFYDISPVTAPVPYETLSSRLPEQYYIPQPQPHTYTLSQPTNQGTYNPGGPVQHPIPQYLPTPPQQPLTSLRPSSGAWSPSDDSTLMQARAQGMNWAPIQTQFFPNKTANACRKRHERLMERRNADDWDGIKLEQLAKEYMDMRKEIWSGLAERLGEKWSVVEMKCMSTGLKNLQTSARAHTRRERLSTHQPNPSHSHSHSHSHSQSQAYPFQSSSPSYGIEDLDPDYEPNDGASDRSGSSTYQGAGGRHGQSYSGGSYTGQNGQGNSRIPSMDMGIDAIINRPRQ